MKRNAVLGFVVFFLMLPVPGVEAESIEMTMQALHRFGGSTSFVCNPSEAVDEIHCSISATGAADGDFNAGLSDSQPTPGQSVTVSAELANYVYSSHAGTQDLKVAQITVWGTTTDSAETVELASFDVVMDVPYFAEAVNGLTGERLGAFAAHDVTPPGVSTEVAAPPTMAGYDFAGWRGRAVDLGCVSMASDLTVRFNMYRYFITLGETTQCRLTATYVPEPDSTLTISSTEGGAVTYPGEGAFAYSSGETTPVVAAAETGYEFAGWSGTAVSTGKVDDAHAATALVEIDGDDTLVANFSAITGVTHTLNTSSGSGGSVTLPGEGEFIYSAGSSVLVEAEAENGYRFSGWSGTAVSAGKLADTGVPLTTVTMDGDYTLRASFSPVVVVGRWLTISSGIGGSVTSPGEGGFIYTPGSRVSVVATAETGYKFARWTGTAVSAGKVIDPSAASTTVIVDDDHTLYAEFSTMVGSTYALTISSEAGGSGQLAGRGDVRLRAGQCGVRGGHGRGELRVQRLERHRRCGRQSGRCRRGCDDGDDGGQLHTGGHLHDFAGYLYSSCLFE